MKNIFLTILLIVIFFYSIFYFKPSYQYSQKPFYDNVDNKLWAHRILDKSIALSIRNDVPGIEVDVFYESDLNIFDVRHHGKLQSKSLYNFLNDLDSVKIWLDIKNINVNNIDLINKRLIFLKNNFNISNRLIIESKKINLLSKIQDSGFNVSYWVPSFHILKSLFEINKIKNNLIKYKPNAISCPHSSVFFYSNKFPNYNLHCWTNGVDLEKNIDVIYNLCERNNVKIVLVDKIIK